MNWFKNFLTCIVQKTLIILVDVYRLVLSPHLGGACRFTPSCSLYAQQALKTMPLPQAVKMIAKRIIHCVPFGPFGYAPLKRLKDES